jgi:hypothetical protein
MAPRVCLPLAALAALASAAPSCSSIPASLPWTDCAFSVPSYGALPNSGVTFSTADASTQALFAHADASEASNVVSFAPSFVVLVEGGGYKNVWLETQPMGGAYYGARNLTLALNNQLIFTRTQRADGRLPGMVTAGGNGVVHPTYSYPGNANLSMLQGFYMASPAVDVAGLLAAGGAAAAAAALLAELQPALERFDAWLWATRNSTSGVLWLAGTADTGEDNSDKYRPLPGNALAPPFESMDMMAYAHDAERALARIARLAGDAPAAQRWDARAAATAAALKARLWRDDLGAAFDRERDGAQAFVSSLLHNNVRAMWSGVFDQGMADAFVARHLMNRSEFWTPAPLPSISVADPRFKNAQGNNWSGPPQGLTYLRAVRALSETGHHAELLLAGAAQKAALLRTGRFPQQINPLTAAPDAGDGYGPMILAFLELQALTTGVALRAAPAGGLAVLFSAVAISGAGPVPAFNFSQRLGPLLFTARGFGNGTFAGELNGRPLFSCAGSARVVADVNGAVTGVVGAGADAADVALALPGLAAPLALHVAPNEEWAVQGAAPPTLARKTPFTPPYS